MTREDMLFVEDIVQLFGVSANTVHRKKWRQETGIPLHKIGKKLCGFRQEVERWAKSK